jgi:probable phosphoglycerate mutase
MGEIVLMRHGETEWSASRRHTSYTDLDLLDAGVEQAKALAAAIAGRTFAAVVSSPRRRALRTAELAGLTPTEVTEDVAEWNYGEYEGVTTPTSNGTVHSGASGPTARPAARRRSRSAPGSMRCWSASRRCSTGATSP